MPLVNLHLDPETERTLREKAALAGQTLETYLEQLAQNDAGDKGGALASSGQLSDEEFDQLLDALSAGPTLAPLPADFSRADIYTDHD
jgi:hypothetical protein